MPTYKLPFLRPLSLTKKLTLLIFLAYLVPLLSMITLLQKFVTEQYDQQILEKAQLSLQETTELAVTYLESMIEASRRLTYDGAIDHAYGSYLVSDNVAELYQWTESSLNSIYRYNSLLLSAALFYDDPNLNAHFLNNDSQRKQYEVEDTYLALEEEFQHISGDLGAYVGFFSADNQLFLLRNLLDSNLTQYGLLILEVNTNRVLGAFQGITGVYSVEIAYDDAVIRQGLLLPVPHLMQMSYEREVERYQLQVTLGVDNTQGEDALEELTQRVTQVSLLIVPSLAYMFFNFYRHITQPLDVLMASQRRVEQGDLGFQVKKIPSSREFQALTLGFNAMSRSMKEQFQQSYQEQLALQDARMKTLQRQINPHFLNNTLEIINWETRIAGNTTASSMIEALSVMLGATMDREGKVKIPFHQELTYVDAYLYIQSCRLGSRLTVIQEIDPSVMDFLVPRLAFQPIVENAFEHGVSAQKKGEVIISAYISEENLILEVRNSGAMSPQDLNRIETLLKWDESTQDYVVDSVSLGVRNVNHRVKLMYGQEYGLHMFNNDQGYTVAILAFPLEMEKMEDMQNMDDMEDIDSLLTSEDIPPDFL